MNNRPTHSPPSLGRKVTQHKKELCVLEGKTVLALKESTIIRIHQNQQGHLHTQMDIPGTWKKEYTPDKQKVEMEQLH